MDEPTLGMGSTYWNAIWDPWQPWPKCGSRRDRRLFPARGGGRRMRHPFFDPIVYPELPSKTLNFGYNPLRHVKSVLTKTLQGTAVAKFKEDYDDVVIREVWTADTLSTLTGLFHQFHRYYVGTLPTGRFIGWQPKDLSPKNFFIDLLNVECGPAEDFEVEELGTERPFMLRTELRVTFKLVREVKGAAGVITGVGD